MHMHKRNIRLSFCDHVLYISITTSTGCLFSHHRGHHEANRRPVSLESRSDRSVSLCVPHPRRHQEFVVHHSRARLLTSYTAVLIIIGGKKQDNEKSFESVEPAAVHANEYAMPFETNVPIHVCRKPKVPIAENWPTTKHFF